jgi:hypothetical protein
MPHTLEEINALFAELRVEWNASEALVKSAEQVCGDAIIPSIKEFRYAGRRVVDAFATFSGGTDLIKAKAFIQDAIFNCHCARHDAIDVATGIMASTMEVAVKKIGYQHILAAFPKFADLRRHLSAVRIRIRASRGDRENRDAIYQAVHEAEFPALMALYEEFQGAEDLMKSLARRERIELTFTRGTTVISVVAALVLAYVALFKKPDCPVIQMTTPAPMHQAPLSAVPSKARH